MKKICLLIFIFYICIFFQGCTDDRTDSSDASVKLKFSMRIVEDDVSLFFPEPDYIYIRNISGVKLSNVYYTVTLKGEKGDEAVQHLARKYWDDNEVVKLEFLLNQSVLNIQTVMLSVKSSEGKYKAQFFKN